MYKDMDTNATSATMVCTILWTILCVLIVTCFFNKYKKYGTRNVDRFTGVQVDALQKELNNNKELYSYMINRIPATTTDTNRLERSVHTIDELNQYAERLGTELNYQCRTRNDITNNTSCYIKCNNSNHQSTYADIKNTNDGYKLEVQYSNRPNVLVDGLPKTLDEYCNMDPIHTNHWKPYIETSEEFVQ